MAVVAAAAFITATSAARAETVTAGTWDARITGGTLGVGDGDLRGIPVPAGDPFTFTIPAGASAPVAFRAPAMHIPIAVHSTTGGPPTRATSGSLDVSPIAGTIDPATGALTGTATAHGLLRLDFTDTDGSSNSFYCQLGDAPPPPESPAPPSPFALGFAGTLASGTLTDTTFALQLNCGLDFGTPNPDLPIIGHALMPSGNELTLTAAFTRRPDPTPPAAPKVTVTPPPPTVAVAKCVVPKLKGLTLKKARKAAVKANCAVGKVKRKRSARKPSTVLKQGARAGKVLTLGSRITLTVAKR